MAIIDVKMLSGFIPVRSSLEKVKNGNGTYENTDSTNGLILFPFLADQTESSFVEKINKYVCIYVCIHTCIYIYMQIHNVDHSGS
uniref:Alpha-macroglobulin receptor-binding domain-containing protein n=1 Tax=Accipiter nisus TaxID=211598 RepID=A0A8B9NHF6_9AVES